MWMTSILTGILITSMYNIDFKTYWWHQHMSVTSRNIDDINVCQWLQDVMLMTSINVNGVNIDRHTDDINICQWFQGIFMLSIKINANDLETLMTLNTNVRDFKYCRRNNGQRIRKYRWHQGIPERRWDCLCWRSVCDLRNCTGHVREHRDSSIRINANAHRCKPIRAFESEEYLPKNG